MCGTKTIIVGPGVCPRRSILGVGRSGKTRPEWPSKKALRYTEINRHRKGAATLADDLGVSEGRIYRSLRI